MQGTILNTENLKKKWMAKPKDLSDWVGNLTKYMKSQEVETL